MLKKWEKQPAKVNVCGDYVEIKEGASTAMWLRRNYTYRLQVGLGVTNTYSRNSRIVFAAIRQKDTKNH